MNDMTQLQFAHSLKMPLSTGTVCTPYDSRMIDKRLELQGRIAARTKRQLKIRTKLNLNHKPLKQDSINFGITIAVFVSTICMAGLLVTPFLINAAA